MNPIQINQFIISLDKQNIHSESLIKSFEIFLDTKLDLAILSKKQEV